VGSVLTTFDPILGTVFDNETFVSGEPREVRFAQVGSNLRAVVLTGTAGRTVYLFAKLLKVLVARDGIEPPTPAFSGPPTESRKWFEINGSC
jgi:hypothetical protein